VCGLSALYPSSSDTAKVALKELGDSHSEDQTQHCRGKQSSLVWGRDSGVDVCNSQQHGDPYRREESAFFAAVFRFFGELVF
jgi:hypothetical protein